MLGAVLLLGAVLEVSCVIKQRRNYFHLNKEEGYHISTSFSASILAVLGVLMQ